MSSKKKQTALAKRVAEAYKKHKNEKIVIDEFTIENNVIFFPKKEWMTIEKNVGEDTFNVFISCRYCEIEHISLTEIIIDDVDLLTAIETAINTREKLIEINEDVKKLYNNN